MFEIIGMIVVVWIAFVIIKSLFTLGNQKNNIKLGQETREIAINQLGVPEQYYNYTVLKNMDSVKLDAKDLENLDAFQNYSWTDLLACVIYDYYYQDCEQYMNGNPVIESRLRELGVMPHEAAETLKKAPKDVCKSKKRT